MDLSIAGSSFIQRVVDSSVDGILAFDLECRYTVWNPGMERISGMKSKEVLGRSAFEVFPFLKETGEDRFFQKALKGEAVIAKDRPYQVPGSGQQGFFEGHYSPLRDEQGRIVGGLAIIRDITVRKQAERALQESEENFRSVTETANDAIISADSNGDIFYFNGAAERMFGYHVAEVLGRSLTVLMPRKYHTAHESGLNRFLQTGESRVIGKTAELSGLRKDGTEFPIELSLASRKTDKGIFFTGIIRDITDRRKAEQAMQKAREELELRVSERTADLEKTNALLREEIAERKRAEEKLRQEKENLERANLELDSFVYIASHDLRTPLRAIASFSGILASEYRDRLDEGGLDCLNEVNEGARRMNELIDDLLSLSRISRIKNPYEDVAFGGLIASALKRLELSMEQSQAVIQVQKGMPVVHCDRIKMTEVWVNLIDNAIKFSSKGGQRPRIEIIHGEQDGFRRFCIQDNGIGIDPEYHEQIFGMFRRLHSGEYEGTGAGLHIVKKIIEDHKGRIWLESKAGEGAKFCFTLPVLAPAETP